LFSIFLCIALNKEEYDILKYLITDSHRNSWHTVAPHQYREFYFIFDHDLRNNLRNVRAALYYASFYSPVVVSAGNIVSIFRKDCLLHVPCCLLPYFATLRMGAVCPFEAPN
jgi:hypothetical protein